MMVDQLEAMLYDLHEGQFTTIADYLEQSYINGYVGMFYDLQSTGIPLVMDDGMILNQPTIFGYNAKSNRFLAGGEAGSETVVGTQNLMNMIQDAVNNAGSGNGDSEATRALLEAIFNWMRNGGLYKLLIDVLTNGVEFEFDNREIARLVKKYA